MTRASDAELDTHQKALALNLERTIFGSFAEIGAGQEVARWFLRVGAASGTVAKTISAYDKEVSDELYGAGTRYVSRPRLETMLDREWTQLQSQLGESRGASTCFFAFTDTVAARNYAGTNESHGWMGVRFQDRPGGEANDVVLHVHMLDGANVLQQEALGLLGVNLLYAVFHQRSGGDALLRGLADSIAPGRLEIDLIDLRGPAFERWDRRALLVELVRTGLAEVVTFPGDGHLLPPTEVFHNKAVVLAPCTFADVEALERKALTAAVGALRDELGASADEPVALYTLTAAADIDGDPPVDGAALLRGVDRLLERGAGVVITRRRELDQLTMFVNRFTDAAVRFAVGLPALVRVFQDAHQRELEGRMLEAIARLFAQNVRLYVYPLSAASAAECLRAFGADGWQLRDAGAWVSAEQLEPAPPLGHLYRYLLTSGFIVPIVGAF